jgi:hypothetical protein
VPTGLVPPGAQSLVQQLANQYPALAPLLTMYAPQLGAIQAGAALDIAGKEALTNIGLAQTAADWDLRRASLENQLAKAMLVGQTTQADRARQMAELGFIDQDVALAFRRLLNRGQRAALSREMAERSAWSSATARGATVTEGFRRTLDEIARDFENTMGGLRLDAEQAQLAAARGRADVAQALAHIDARAREAGLDTSYLRRAIEIGSRMAGLDSAKLIEQLNQARISGSLEAQTAANNIINQLVTLAAQMDPEIAQALAQAFGSTVTVTQNRAGEIAGGGGSRRFM